MPILPMVIERMQWLFWEANEVLVLTEFAHHLTRLCFMDSIVCTSWFSRFQLEAVQSA